MILALAVSVNAAAATPSSVKKKTSKKVTVSSTHKKISTSKKRSSRRGSWKKRGQQSIASERITEIQQALIRDGYLAGEPSGSMDDRTKAALVKLQQENGWQTKVVPDSRALIKLGLGPSHDNLINPSTAAVATFGATNGNR
jgi:peptidoglycan hydrolase-like protein with peptidoglycan-binding domain